MAQILITEVEEATLICKNRKEVETLAGAALDSR